MLSVSYEQGSARLEMMGTWTLPVRDMSQALTDREARLLDLGLFDRIYGRLVRERADRRWKLSNRRFMIHARQLCCQNNLDRHDKLCAPGTDTDAA